MFNIKFSISFLLFLLVFSSFALSAEGEISLVTVGESSDGERRGGLANLFLEIKPGSGRVFIDSFPFTKEDTQVSIRFAKDVACNFLEFDCSKFDFFYTINIGSSSVGGPSAGAAITVLTISVLSGDVLDDSVLVTGTINSGGIIGPVSGLEEKAMAAKNAGFSKILVPKRSILVDETLKILNESYEINNSSDLNSSIYSNMTIVYADSLFVEGIDIIPVSTLEEVLFEFTGNVYPDYSYDINVPNQYQVIMKRVSEQLCDRAEGIKDKLSEDIILENDVVFNNAINSIALGINASSSSDFYSAASFCFTANSVLRELEFSVYESDVLESIKQNLSDNISSFLLDVNSYDLKTLSDLETYIIVKERLLEAQSLLDENNSLDNLGYIVERFYSAVAWSSFFDFNGKEVSLNDLHLANICVAKISEAEERLSYIDFLTGVNFDRSELNIARSIQSDEDYAFCIFKATKVKADANSIILSLSVNKDKLNELIDDQLIFARMQINKQNEKQVNNFPILGYSYYNYADTLKNSRPELSVVFAEYASEFSNLDMYFPSDDMNDSLYTRLRYNDGFFLGFLVGFAVCIALLSFWLLIHHIFFNKKVKQHKHIRK